jgi:hypothetical protein
VSEIQPELADLELEQVILSRALRLNSTVAGIVTGLVVGWTVFAATVWLVVKGGPVVGPHLALLGHFFIGYTVSWGGAVVGFLYGCGVGFAVGAFVAAVYNRILDLRHRPGPGPEHEAG